MTVTAEPLVTAPESVILLKTTVPVIVPEPAKITVPSPLLKVLLLVKLPPLEIVRVFPPDIVKAALAFIVTLLASAAAELIFGLYVVPDGIVTLVVDVGIVAHDQLAAVFQSTLVPPSHVPTVHAEITTV